MLKYNINLERTARRGWQASHLQVKILLNMTCANWLSRQVGWEKKERDTLKSHGEHKKFQCW